MNNYKICILIILLIVMSCAVQQPIVHEKKTVTIKIPPGVDTLTAVVADSIFSLALVTEADEQASRQVFELAEQRSNLADSLWSASVNGLNDSKDSLVALRQVSQVEHIFQAEKEWLKHIHKLMKKAGRLNSAVLTGMSDKLIVQASQYYESAIRKNRFEIRYRRRYSQFLKELAAQYHDPGYLIRAADEVERIVFVIKGNHQFFSELGEIYSLLTDWKNAYKNYDLAQFALRRTAIFTVPEPKLYFSKPNEIPLDTLRLLYYLDKAAGCKTKLYEALPALSLYREALAITQEPAWQEHLTSRINWVLWDAGNIRASEIKDHADSLFLFQKKYAEAKTIYLALLPSLWTKRTRDEINWKIAQVDFSYLKQKFDGVGRMYQVIKQTSIDSITGAPLDSTYQRYFDSYGAMCFNLGAEHLANDRLTAYIYFSQAAETNFAERARALLQLADLSQFDPDVTIDLCMKTMKFVDDLRLDEKQMLYRLLHSSYRKLGDFQQAKEWFDRWKAL